MRRTCVTVRRDALNVTIIRQSGVCIDNVNTLRYTEYAVEPIAAMRQAETAAYDPNVKGYTDLDTLFRDLKA